MLITELTENLFATKCFHCAVTEPWNDSPVESRELPTLVRFKKQSNKRPKDC